MMRETIHEQRARELRQVAIWVAVFAVFCVLFASH